MSLNNLTFQILSQFRDFEDQEWQCHDLLLIYTSRAINAYKILSWFLKFQSFKFRWPGFTSFLRYINQLGSKSYSKRVNDWTSVDPISGAALLSWFLFLNGKIQITNGEIYRCVCQLCPKWLPVTVGQLVNFDILTRDVVETYSKRNIIFLVSRPF